MVKRCSTLSERKALKEISNIRVKDPKDWTYEDLKKIVVYLSEKAGILKQKR